MGKRFSTIKQKLGIPSGRVIVHFIVVECILSYAWNWISKMFENQLIREIGFLIIFVAAIFAIAWYLPKLSPALSGKGKDKDVIASSKHVDSQSEKGLTQEQVVEHVVFIKSLRAVGGQLLKNSQGAETRSIKSMAHDICSETPVREYIASDGLAGQIDRLLTHQLDDFFIRVSNYQRQVEGLSIGNLDDTNINSICNTTRELVSDYRKLVDEVMVMLTNLENRGVEALWHKAPWSVRIHRELADNYDELMRLVVDLKAVTPSYARDLLPKDDQTSKFKRASLLS